MKHEIIMASAGSGKTYRLSNRIISILLDGVDPRKVIALTFTRKAAGEFSAALFEKISQAALHPSKAEELSIMIDRPGRYGCEDFLLLLERVIEVLPEVYLGTLDSYFTRMVQAFQFELGLSSGAGVKILEEVEMKALREEILNEILFRHPDETTSGFLQAFKLASFGKEEVAVSKKMEEFIKEWHQHFLNHGEKVWGNVKVITEGIALTPWHQQDVESFLGTIEALFGDATSGNKTIAKTIDKVKQTLSEFSGGSGALSNISTFLNNAMQVIDDLLSGSETKITVSKKIPLTGEQAGKLGRVIRALCEEELFVKAVQSKALWEVMQEYEMHYEQKARQLGKLSFNDIKYLLGKWQSGEEARIQRELIDYRLDAQHDHWLLDEFQDTSQDQYDGLKPLLDEIGMDQTGHRSLFIVGDIKQSIYQWRGGNPELFHKISRDYQIPTENMSHSWRSQQPVLSLVNHIFGNQKALQACFGNGAAVKRWEWNEHVQATKPKPAYSEVRSFSDEEEKYAYLLELLQESNPIGRGLSCALLFRENKKVSQYAEKLREAGFPVAEEGKVNPTMDNPVGHLLLSTIKWIINPSDSFSFRHLQLSPLGTHWPQLRADPLTQWKQWNFLLYSHGLFQTLSTLMDPLRPSLSDFGKERLSYLLEEIRAYSGETDALIKRLESLEVPVSESSNVIQVMTIHQSKGLGFEMVIIPEISTSTLANSGKYKVAHLKNTYGNTTFSPPPKEVRAFFPSLSAAEAAWQQEQYYEAFCVLYVALTRAKRSLYVFLPKKPKGEDNYVSWIYKALPPLSSDAEDLLYAAGENMWYESAPYITEQERDASRPPLPPLRKKRGRTFLSGGNRKRRAFTDASAITQGESTHEVMKHLHWLPELPTEISENASFTELSALLMKPEIYSLLSAPKLEPSQSLQVFKEQAIEWIDAQGLWNTVRLDRLHILLENQLPTAIQVIDYKTDDLTCPEALKERHFPQLERYREAVQSLYGKDLPITCHLLNLTHGYHINW